MKIDLNKNKEFKEFSLKTWRVEEEERGCQSEGNEVT